MSRYLPVLNAVRAFEAAGRHGSFIGAAKELNVTHSAISRHVRGLEKQLSVILFRNVARGVELTESGMFYLSEISSALDKISEASEQLKDRASSSITISCEPTFAVKWLMHHCGNFRDNYPDVNLTLVSSAEVADIENSEFDMAIRYCTKSYDGLESVLLAEGSVFPYGSAQIGEIESAEDLLKYRLLHEDKGELWAQWFEVADCTGFSQPEKPSSQPSLLAIEGALAGHGVVLTSPELVADDVKNKQLRRLSDISLKIGGYYIMYHKRSLRRISEIRFRDWLIESTSDLRK